MHRQLILKGITKDVILKVCAENRIAVEERTFTLEELKAADEVFLSSTTSEVMPVVEIDGNQVKVVVQGPLLKGFKHYLKQKLPISAGA